MTRKPALLFFTALLAVGCRQAHPSEPSGTAPRVLRCEACYPLGDAAELRLLGDGSGDLILRLYEAKNADTDCRLSLGLLCAKAWKTDLLENKQEELTIHNGAVPLHFHNFEVRTIRIAQ